MTPVARFETTVLLRSEQSGGQVSAIENAVPAGWGGPPLHHHDFDEAFYVLDGELTFQREQLKIAGPGKLVFAPREPSHACQPECGLGAVPLVCTPAGFERYFEPEARKPFPETIVVGPQIGER